MTNRLKASSRLTLLYKTVLIPLALLALIASLFYSFWTIRDVMVLFFVFLSGLGLVFWWHLRKIKVVTYDDMNLYVKDLRNERTYRLLDVRKIRFQLLTVTFAIELTGDEEDIVFIPKFHIGLLFGYWPDHIIELENRIKKIKGTDANKV